MSDKYGKNSKNNKFNKILHLEREKVKKGFEKSAKFCKNRKSNKNFSCYVKRLSNKYGKNSKNNKFNKILPFLGIFLSKDNILLPMTVSLHSSWIYTPLHYEIQQSHDPYWNTTWRAFPQCPVQLSQF